MQSTKTVLCFLGLLFAAGCAGVPAPTDRIVSARAAIRSASEVGATGTPKAALHLKLAQNGFDEADRLVRADDNEGATNALMRAESDAELAIVLARADHARGAARESEDTQRQQRQHVQSSP